MRNRKVLIELTVDEINILYDVLSDVKKGLDYDNEEKKYHDDGNLIIVLDQFEMDTVISIFNKIEAKI